MPPMLSGYCQALCLLISAQINLKGKNSHKIPNFTGLRLLSLVAFSSDLLYYVCVCVMIRDLVFPNKRISGISHVHPVPANFPSIFSGKLRVEIR